MTMRVNTRRRADNAGSHEASTLSANQASVIIKVRRSSGLRRAGSLNHIHPASSTSISVKPIWLARLPPSVSCTGGSARLWNGLNVTQTIRNTATNRMLRKIPSVSMPAWAPGLRGGTRSRSVTPDAPLRSSGGLRRYRPILVPRSLGPRRDGCGLGRTIDGLRQAGNVAPPDRVGRRNRLRVPLPVELAQKGEPGADRKAEHERAGRKDQV